MAVMHNVATMHEIKTEIGYARAWIRLALERKALSSYLHVLVSDANLLKTLYKRYVSTVWKFHNFPTSQILREISYRKFRSAKSAQFDMLRGF